MIGVKHSLLYIGSLPSYSEFGFTSSSSFSHVIRSYPLSFALNAAYSLALRLRLIPHHSGSTADLESGGYASLPGGARAEAERRR